MQQHEASISPRSQHRDLRRMGSNSSLSSSMSSKETHNLFPSLGNMLESSVSQITEAFKNLTSFVSLLDSRIQDVEKENAGLRQQLSQATNVQSQQQSEITDLREKLNNLAQQLEQVKRAGVQTPTQPAPSVFSSSSPAPPPSTPPSSTPAPIHSASSSLSVPPPPTAPAKKVKVYVKHDLTLTPVKTPTKKAPKTIANLFNKYKPHSSAQQPTTSSARSNLSDLELLEKALDFAVAEIEKQAGAPVDLEMIDTKQYKQPVRSSIVIFVVRLKVNQDIEDWNAQVLDEVQEFFAQNNKIIVLTLKRIPCSHPELAGNSNAQLEYNGVSSSWKQVVPGSHHAKARTLNFFTLGIDDSVNDFIPGEQNGQEIKKLSTILEQAP